MMTRGFGVKKVLRKLSVDLNPLFSAEEKMRMNTITSDNISTQNHIASLLAWLAKSINSRTIIETGTFRGITTTALAKANPKATVYTFEISGEHISEAMKAIKKYSNIKVIKGNVNKMLPKLLESLDGVDFAYLDSSKRSYLESFWAIDRKLKFGGIIAAHDTYQVISGAEGDERYSINFRKYIHTKKDYSCVDVDRHDRGLTIAQKKGVIDRSNRLKTKRGKKT